MSAWLPIGHVDGERLETLVPRAGDESAHGVPDAQVVEMEEDRRPRGTVEMPVDDGVAHSARARTQVEPAHMPDVAGHVHGTRAQARRLDGLSELAVVTLLMMARHA
jgi:hypothetical protein